MNRPEIKISFLGGASDIGASSALVEVGTTAILVDCGVRFHGDRPLPDLSVLQDKRLDAIAVTHAHSDHTGGLPAVCQAFLAAPVYASPPTIEIAMILLRDALKLMNTEDREGDVPLYSEKQVNQVVDAFVPVHHGQERTVGDVTLTFLPASHILGASMLHLATPAGNVLFTGDYSVSAQFTVPALTRPALPVDLIVTEATYGDRLHEDRATAEKRLLGQIKEVVESGGRVLMPAFAVGRAQEVLLILKRALRNGELPAIPVFVDGMVRAVCGVYGRHERYVSRALHHDIRRAAHPFYTNGIKAVQTPGERREILSLGPCVIVASSGMLSGGASAFYAAALAPNPKDAILITGYQDEESPGRALLALCETDGAREIKIGDKIVEARCRIQKYGLSAHADRMQMIGLVESVRPGTAVLVHGDKAAKEFLADGLNVKDVILAEDGGTIVRCFPPRRGSEKVNPRVDKIDIDTARKLLGPPTGALVSARKVAEAWSGGEVRAEEVDRLAVRLEALGLVRRDDHRRRMLCVLGPSETDLFPEEAALEETIKLENPKGRLLELCMRRKIDPPAVQIEVDGAFFEASATLDFAERRLESGVHRAASKKTAEQLAAKKLVELIAGIENSEQVTEVSREEARALKIENPKGRLIEWCAGHKMRSPDFEARAVLGMFQARAVMQLSGGEIHSKWRSAVLKKVAEQAAAKELLNRIEKGDPGEDAVASPESSDSEGRGSAAHGVKGILEDPMMLLNEMRQVGILVDFGYDLKSMDGPCHQPMFSIAGWAQIDDGSRIETEPVATPSKKTGRRRSAENLVASLRDKGLLASGKDRD